MAAENGKREQRIRFDREQAEGVEKMIDGIIAINTENGVVYKDLVKCKNCKYYTEYNECTNPAWECSGDDYPVVKETDFCSKGEMI